MTKLERQRAAVSMAVRVAVYKIGADAIARSEFFGTNQRLEAQLDKAA